MLSDHFNRLLGYHFSWVCSMKDETGSWGGVLKNNRKCSISALQSRGTGDKLPLPWGENMHKNTNSLYSTIYIQPFHDIRWMSSSFRKFRKIYFGNFSLSDLSICLIRLSYINTLNDWKCYSNLGLEQLLNQTLVYFNISCVWTQNEYGNTWNNEIMPTDKCWQITITIKMRFS